MFDLKGKVAVITGASSGLGKQMSYAFAEQGANLVLVARNKIKLEEVEKDLRKKGANVVSIKCDVTKTDEIKETVKLTKDTFGKVDILINCAGASRNNDVLNMTDDQWDFTINTDLTSVFKVTRAFANLMIENKTGGRIINISSMYGLVGNTEIPTIAYHSSKGGVINFTRAAAAELAKYNITVNCVCPGYFNTELTKDVLKTRKFQKFAKLHVPMGRYGKEGELNGIMIFLSSDEASYITGAIIPVDGGYTCV